MIKNQWAIDREEEIKKFNINSEILGNKPIILGKEIINALYQRKKKL